MSKRPATTTPENAAKRVKENVDAMGCIIMAVKRSNDNLHREMSEVKEQNAYLHRQVERLDGYTQELEGRLAAMEAVLSNMLNTGNHHVVEEMIVNIRGTREYDMTDLDRLLDEFATDDEEETNWFDELFQDN